jgi:hypothetical protein
VKFLLSVYADPGQVRAEDHERFRTAARESGELVDGEAVADASTSAVVRLRDGVPTVTDGPYLASPVQLTAYYLIDCQDRERAIELAATLPAARSVGVEVRPVMRAGGLEM